MKKLEWQDLAFVETDIIEPPATKKEAHEKHRLCFSHAGNFRQATEAQQHFIAMMIRAGGYHGRLIVNEYGQFFNDVRPFYADGLDIQYGDKK